MNKYLVPGRNIRLATISVIRELVGVFSTYLCIIPLILMDIAIWQFQNIYFRSKEIPLLERQKYVVLDRYKLGKLTVWQKINCLYCEYANGIVGYSKAVVNQMELYSCAIKHQLHPLGQEHQDDFFERKEFE